MAYRSRKEERRTEAATEGLVVDMVQQFADKYAFVRELVQNGIDAGASRLTLRARYLGGEGVFSLSDDGVGMTRDIIEGPLLTLFNSAKDEDETKIGKYGVGFVSVFAIDPDEVLVETWRGDQSWSLSLLPDHSYELAHGDEREASGTVVSLRKRMSRDDFGGHADGVLTALRHWCKHARIPIDWYIDEEGGEPRHERIDRPLAVDAPVSVDVDLDPLRIVIGVSDGDGFAGFYNHGLTLWEGDAAGGLPGARRGIVFKVDSPALSHTLSRDNVRHDAAFDEAMRRVRELTTGQLRRETILRLQAAADGGEDDEEDYEALLVAGCNGALAIDADEISVPLCHAIHRSSVCPAHELVRDGRALYETAPNAITAALAKREEPVLLADWDIASLEALATKIGAAIHPASTVYALLEPRARAKSYELALCARVADALRAARVAVDTVGLARTTDAPLSRAGVRVDSASTPQLVLRDERRARFSLRRPPDLFLVTTHEMVKAARRLARSDVTSAAQLLTRYLLVESKGELSKRENDALLAKAVSAWEKR